MTRPPHGEPAPATQPPESAAPARASGCRYRDRNGPMQEPPGIHSGARCNGEVLYSCKDSEVGSLTTWEAASQPARAELLLAQSAAVGSLCSASRVRDRGRPLRGRPCAPRHRFHHHGGVRGGARRHSDSEPESASGESDSDSDLGSVAAVEVDDWDAEFPASAAPVPLLACPPHGLRVGAQAPAACTVTPATAPLPFSVQINLNAPQVRAMPVPPTLGDGPQPGQPLWPPPSAFSAARGRPGAAGSIDVAGCGNCRGPPGPSHRDASASGAASVAGGRASESGFPVLSDASVSAGGSESPQAAGGHSGSGWPHCQWHSTPRRPGPGERRGAAVQLSALGVAGLAVTGGGGRSLRQLEGPALAAPRLSPRRAGLHCDFKFDSDPSRASVTVCGTPGPGSHQRYGTSA